MKNLKILLFVLGICFVWNSNAQSSEPIAGNLNQQQVDSLENEVEQLYTHGKYGESIEILKTLTQHFKKQNNQNKIYSIQLRLADINRAAQNFDYTIRIIENLIQVVPWGDRELRAKIYYLKGATYFELDSLDNAIKFTRTALSIAKSLDNLEIVAGAYNVLGASYRTISSDSSLFFTRLAAQVYRQTKDTMNLSLAYYNIGNTLNSMHQYDSAIYYSKRSLEIANKFEIPTYQILALNNLAASNKSLKNYELAFDFMEQRDSIEKVIISTKNAVKINQLMEKIEEEQEAQEKTVLLERLDADDKLNGRKNLFLLLALIIVIILALFASIIYRKDNERKKDLLKMEKLNKEVNQYSNKMTELNNSKDKILSIISHDLRSPFSQLITFLSFAEEGELSEEDMKIVNKEMLISSRNGLHILDNLLYWANNQREGKKIVKRNFIVAESIDEIKTQTNYLAKNKKVKIIINCPLQLSIRADKVLFEIVIRNLLSNAIKFSPLASSVKIEVTNTNGNVEIAILDQGAGIPMEVIKAIEASTLEYKTTPGTGGEKGAGMGLYLSMEFAKQNNGNIRFDLQKTGTKAVFSIPED